MLDYKEIIIKHYGGGMSGSELAGQMLGSKPSINDFLLPLRLAKDQISASGKRHQLRK